MLLFYLTSSVEDVHWRTDYLVKLNTEDDGLGAQLQQVLLSQLKTTEDASIPWDLRWFADLLQTHGRDQANKDAVNNRISLALFCTTWFSLQQNFKGSGTLAALTQAIEGGSLTEEVVPDRLLVSVPRFM